MKERLKANLNANAFTFIISILVTVVGTVIKKPIYLIYCARGTSLLVPTILQSIIYFAMGTGLMTFLICLNHRKDKPAKWVTGLLFWIGLFFVITGGHFYSFYSSGGKVAAKFFSVKAVGLLLWGMLFALSHTKIVQE